MQNYINGIPVSEHDYAAYQEKKKKRNKIILIVVLAKIALLAVIIFFVTFKAKEGISSVNAYPEAKAIIEQDAQVLEITGGIEGMFASESKFETAGPFTLADFTILVDGVDKDAVVTIHMTKTLSGWKQTGMEVEQN